MAVDRLTDDDPEKISGSIREKQHEHARRPADGIAAEKEVAETRTRAEYYQALMAILDQQPRTTYAASGSADTSPRSAWDNADHLKRPALDSSACHQNG